MANGFVFGKGGTPVGGGNWEVATVEITDVNMSQVPLEGDSGMDCYFESTVYLPDHMVFQTREFTSKSDFWDACGQSRENVMVSSAYISGPNQIYVGNGIMPTGYKVTTRGYTGSPAPLSSFTLYIFARFVN